MSNIAYREKIQYFNDLSNRWDEVVGNDAARKTKLREVFSSIALGKGATVIDVGCGTGILFPFIEERVGAEGTIIALDAAPEMIEEAKRKHAHFQNIRYVASTLENAELAPNCADVILCFAVFPHIENKTAALSKCRSALKENGTLYIFHLADTKTLNEFHQSLNAPVKGDIMPGKEELDAMLTHAGFHMVRYIDKAELNFVEAHVL